MKGVKQRLYNKIFPHFDYSWGKGSAAYLFTSALQSLQEGSEFIFSAQYQKQNSSAGHAVLFSCGSLKRPDHDKFYLRLYDTGGTAPISTINKITTTAKGFWTFITGGDVIETLENNLQSVVDQAFFTREQLQSSEFLTILTDELLRYEGLEIEAGKAPFQQYDNFKMNNALPEETLENPPQPLPIQNQIAGNCAIAPRLAYLQQAMSSELYTKFSNHLMNKYHPGQPLLIRV